MKIEKYKKIMIVRMFLLSILALLAVGLGIYDMFLATAEIKASEIFEFQCGITTALGILCLLRIIQYRKALRNDKELQIQYNKENDERMKAIRAKGCFLYINCSRGDTVGDCLYHKVYIYQDNIRNIFYDCFF